MATNTFLEFRNKETGKPEVIDMQDFEFVDWGCRFFVNNESEAYKAAYLYRSSKHGAKVEFAGAAKRWMVTVFNEVAAQAGLDLHG